MISRNFIFILILALTFGLGIAFYQWWDNKDAPKVEEQSQVLLERVKTVSKLITVEGYFSEVMNYKDYWGYDFFLFQKKALILVKARVSVGYDLAAMNLKSDTNTKTITLTEPPAPQILSIDHDLSYYDIKEGTFNSFTAEDYTKMQGKAKEFVREKAEKSDLKEKATLQGNQMMDVIRFMVESAGWKLNIEKNAGLPIAK
jgi:hypothetical protein